jgi:3D-(3,5/4)-trihydroxycyclohexane-1,2-dione acylhydrolase (decyclizing)
MINAAGSMPGDLVKTWRTRDPQGYHVEYGYSCMGYEIAAGVGVKLAAPEREVIVLVGDGSYLMLAQELVTAVQEGLQLTVVLVDNHGFSSIGNLSRSVGAHGFGTQYRRRSAGSLGLDDDPQGELLPVDLAANAESLGAHVVRAATPDDVAAGIAAARGVAGPTVVHVTVDRYEGVPGYESWWDVPVAEVSDVPEVQAARAEYEQRRRAQRRPL